MKKLIVLGMVACLALFAGVAAYANSDSESVGVLVTVGEKFSLDVDTHFIDMGTVEEGNGGFGAVTLYCSSNRANPWWVSIRGDAVMGTRGFTISPVKFNTWSVDGSHGDFYSGTAEYYDSMLYSAAYDEWADTDVRVGLGLVINIPYGTPADMYTSIVDLTMTE